MFKTLLPLEFTDILGKTKSICDPEADLREAFRIFDLDGDGHITVLFHIQINNNKKNILISKS